MTSEQLGARQVEVYRRMGWTIDRDDGHEAVAIGPHGVPWYIIGADAARLSDPALAQRLDELREVRVDDGERLRLCPVDIVSTAEAEPEAKELLSRLRLDRAAHVNVYVVMDET